MARNAALSQSNVEHAGFQDGPCAPEAVSHEPFGKQCAPVGYRFEPMSVPGTQPRSGPGLTQKPVL